MGRKEKCTVEERIKTVEVLLCHAINNYMKFYAEERPQERFNCKTSLKVRTEALATSNPLECPILENKRIKKYKKNGVHRKNDHIYTYM